MTSYPEPSADVVQALSRIGTATIHEALGRSGELDLRIRPLWEGARVCGTAFPVECGPGDNLMIHYALSVAGRGDVLIVATGAGPETGSWGLVTTRAAQFRGIHGLVIDGYVRDSESIEELSFPVFCKGRSIRGTTKSKIGRAGVPIEVGGQLVGPGDVVVGDLDGVVIVPGSRCAEVLEAARARDQKEEDLLNQIDVGVSSVTLLGLSDVLKSGGFE